MQVLQITPPFSYTYQCGSTLLTSYLPVYMYSISLQIFFLVATLVFIFSSNLTQYPNWLLELFPGIYWPICSFNDNIRDVNRLIGPSQITSSAMNHFILLLSFGLCSPVLCCYIALSLCANLYCWLMLIGRFVSFHRDLSVVGSPPQPPSSPPSIGLLSLFIHHSLPRPLSLTTLSRGSS
jgi:hypothetical protein